MKKNIIKSFLIALVALSVVSCKEDERKGYLGDEDFVRFLQSSGVVDEIGNVYPVVIAFTKKDANKTATVTFAVEEISARAGVDYEILNEGNTITFGPGKYTDTIFIKPLENDIACGPNREFKIKITAVDGAFAGFPKTGGATEFTMGIREVVAFDIENFYVGSPDGYICEEFELNGTPYADNPIDVQVTIAPGLDNTFAVENLGDWGGLTAFLTFNPDVTNQTIQILETPNGYTQGGVPLLWTGSGTYNVCTREFEVQYAFKRSDNGNLLVPAINKFRPK